MGALADAGPHVVDLLDAALGPITEVVGAHRTPEDLWHLIFRHENGATSSATVSIALPVGPSVVDFSVYGTRGYRTLNRDPRGAASSYTVFLDDFVSMIATGTTTHPCDVHRGLHLQRLLGQALSLDQLSS
jgi:hypothetical protein